MAKKVNRTAYTPDVTPGADPNGGNVLLSRRMGTVLGCACLLVFILFENLWIGSLAFGIGFTIIFCLEVFYEKSRNLFRSFNFYGALICYILAYAEYAYGFMTNLMKIG